MNRYHLLVILAILLSSSLVLAAPNIKVDKIDKGSVIIQELDNPAVFDFVINFKAEEPETFEIYSLLSVSMSPKNKFTLKPGLNVIEVKAFPFDSVRKNNLGFYQFEYQIKGQNSGIFKDKLLIKIVPLSEVIEITGNPLHPDDKEAIITIRNNENTQLDKVIIEFESPFFKETKSISLGPREKTDVSVKVSKKTEEETTAGPYNLIAKIKIEDEETKLKSTITYLEKESISLKSSSEGVIIRETVLERTNKGNIPTTTSISMKKDVISRLFTLNSPEPSIIEREGLAVTYSWQADLAPNESLTVKSTTNYTLPFIIILLAIIIALLTKIYSFSSLGLTKKVSLVKTKGGEFALKVRVRAKAKSHLENIQVIDSIPAMAKLYEGFGHKPDKIDPHTKRMFWTIDKMNKGEEKVFSYIIYSKLNVTGRFELSPALALFEKNGMTKETLSNRAFFAAEKD
jgi:hypothetical protein